ncbi:MAG TPA: TylF/MycF/NovP-related O-methyltransferase [Polyangiaceae bacterium]|nr:TylF/MycF/NovP-related O-methyltransferase [Polyangiaceae bacterium]
MSWPAPYRRVDELDPMPYETAWPDLRGVTGRVDVHSLIAFYVLAQRFRGMYLEFGVGAGRSAVAAMRANRRYNPEGIDRFFLFDSFEGLPALEGRDEGSKVFQQGQYAFSVTDVRAKLEKHGVWDEARVTFVPGFFEQSLPAFDLARFGGRFAPIVHVDVDLHASARQVLDFVTPLLRQGSVILFDDWNVFDASWQKGERAAAREWLVAHPGYNLESYAKYGFHGEAFIVHC